MNLIILEHFWVRAALANMLTSIVFNSQFAKRPGARDMTIFGPHVGLHIPNIGYLAAYRGI